MKQHIFFIFFVSILALPASMVHAGEIHYGSLKSQYGATFILEYKGPSGTDYYTCTTDNVCESEGDEAPNLLPKLLGSSTYVTNSSGTLGIKPFIAGSAVYYFLYNTSTETPKKIALIPYTQKGATVRFSSNSTAVVFEYNNMYTRYDIQTKKLTTLTLPKVLSFFTISPDANYLAGYNYSTLQHEVWRFSDRKKLAPPSSMQSYLEFSEDEKQIAFLDDEEGFKTLFTMKTSELGNSNPASLTQLTKPETETEDYLFANNTLYFMANVESALEWDLFSYIGGSTQTIAEDVSYGDYLKRVTTSDGTFLAFLKTDGKNTNISLVDKESNTTTLTPVRTSKLSSKVEREVVEYGDSNGVLLSPKSGGEGNLFIWMHGGPQRQVAKEYHSYLSYAVYDEMLERLVEDGNYVYKIDYTGSSGYGADFRKALTMHVGDTEMEDVEDAIDEIKKDLDIDNVYLIGNSYGGYMALRGIVEYPKKLDGVVSINGVSDWYGLIQAIPSSPFSSVFNGVPDTDNLDAYMQASVFTGMDELTSKDKVLVVWGENDSTVPVWQSTKYVEFAEKQGVNLETLSFSDEDHILRKRENLNKLYDTIVDFLHL